MFIAILKPPTRNVVYFSAILEVELEHADVSYFLVHLASVIDCRHESHHA